VIKNRLINYPIPRLKNDHLTQVNPNPWAKCPMGVDNECVYWFFFDKMNFITYKGLYIFNVTYVLLYGIHSYVFQSFRKDYIYIYNKINQASILTLFNVELGKMPNYLS